MWTFWLIRGHVAEGRRWLEGLLTSIAPVSLGVRAKALNGASFLALQNADLDCAQALAEDGLALCRQLGDLIGAAKHLNSLAVVTSERGNPGAAVTLFEESLAVFRAAEDDLGIANALANLGITARKQARLDDARALLEQAQRMYLALGNRRTYGNTLHTLGNIATDMGDLVQAGAYYNEALVVGQELGDWAVVARCMESVAGILAKQQRHAALAAQLFGAAEAMREQIGVPGSRSGRAAYASSVAVIELLLAPAHSRRRGSRAVASREDAR